MLRHERGLEMIGQRDDEVRGHRLRPVAREALPGPGREPRRAARRLVDEGGDHVSPASGWPTVEHELIAPDRPPGREQLAEGEAARRIERTEERRVGKACKCSWSA